MTETVRLPARTRLPPGPGRARVAAGWILLCSAAWSVIGCGGTRPPPDHRAILAEVQRAESIEERQALLLRMEGMAPEVGRDAALLGAEAELRRSLGDWPGAARRFLDLAAAQPEPELRRASRSAALTCLLDDGRWQAARPVLESLGALRDDAEPRLWALWWATATEGAQLEGALTRLDTALRARPGDPWLMSASALLAWRAGLFGRAYLLAEQALAGAAPEVSWIHTVRAASLASLDASGAAVLYASSPERSPLAMRSHAAFLMAHGRIAEAATLLDGWSRRYPHDHATGDLARRVVAMVRQLPAPAAGAVEGTDD